MFPRKLRLKHDSGPHIPHNRACSLPPGNERGGADNITVVVVRLETDSKGWFSWLRREAPKDASGNGSAGGN